MSILVITRKPGRFTELERHWISDVEAFFADTKNTLVRLRNGEDTFPTKLTSETQELGGDGLVISLKAIEKFLKANGCNTFCRAHDAWLVNTTHMQTYKSNTKARTHSLTTSSGLTINASRRAAPQVKKAFMGITP